MSMVAAIKNQHLDVIACFLDEGFPISIVVSAAASKVGSVEIYQTFLDYGWDINERSEGGCAALKFVLTNPLVRSRFLSHGASPNITDSEGYSSLTIAAFCTPVSFLSQLLKAGGDPTHSNALHNAVEIPGAEGIEKASKYEWNPHFWDMYKRPSGFAPQHIAVARGDGEMVALLVERGADPLVQDRFGRTLLQMARAVEQEPFLGIREALERAVERRGEEAVED